MNEIIYNDGEIELKVSLEKDSIWLSTNDIADIFEVNRPAIVKHIGNIYKTDELLQESTCSILEQVAADGKKRKINFYNLDMIISVGYRVNSKKATKFRQWANQVLKQYISDGYSINSNKLTESRLSNLENSLLDMRKEFVNNKISTDTKIGNITKTIELKEIKPSQGIFYDGQTFDAYVFVADIIKSAKSSIVLIDNFVDETVLMLLSKRASTCKATIYTKAISKQLQLDLKKHNEQYLHVEIKKFDASHDRFLIIDEKEVYHIGASLKDLGKKWFGFSKMDSESFEMMGKLK